MDSLYDLLRFLHILGFAFMSVPLFNLIVVNERVSLSKTFNYHADRYMENIIKHGAYRCFVFQTTVFITGVMLCITGPLGFESIWSNWILAVKTVLLFILMALLSYVHFHLQSRIELIFAEIKPDSQVPEDLASLLKRYRVRRKWLATLCLFIVIATIVFGIQVYDPFKPAVTIGLLGLGVLFSWKANKTLLRFGWV